MQDAFASGGDKRRRRQTAANRVHRPRNGTQDPAVKAAMTPFFDEVDKFDGVKVVSPYDPGGRGVQQPSQADLVRQQLSVTKRSSPTFIKLADKIKARGDQVEVHQD